MPTLQPDRVLYELEELAQLTSDGRGAQRLTWTEPWRQARSWLRAKLSELPVEVDEDEASNLWATLPGRSERTLMIGSHLDSVPDGGSLDGCLGVLAGLEILRRIADEGEPPEVSVCLVDWAEEEGDQSGHSLLGSTAAAGHLDVELLRTLTSWEGRPVPELLAVEGIDLERMPRAHDRLANAAAYLELHIEQSVLLERQQMPLGVVTGTAGVERHRITFSGRRDHPARPMDDRSDALIAACRFIVGVRELARELGGSSLTGQLEVEPNVPLIVADSCSAIFDIRAFDAPTVAQLMEEWRELAAQIAREERVDFTSALRWRIDPAPFDPTLIELAEQAVIEAAGASTRLGSPQLHDAGQMALAGVPTVMLFVQSLGGVSHSAGEASDPGHLRMAVQALDGLARRAMAWLSG